MILYYSLDGSHWSYCETRPIFNLVDTRCNRIVTAWRPFGTFHQQRFCYSVSVAWDHPLQSASLEIIELSLCHQIYPLDAFLPIFVLFMWTPCLSPKSWSRISVTMALHWALSGQAHCHKQLLHKSGVFAFWNVLTDPIAPTWYPHYPLRSPQLCSAATSSVLWWDHSADRAQASFLSSEHNAAPSFGWRKEKGLYG